MVEEVVEEDVGVSPSDDDVPGNVQFFRKHVLPYCIGFEQQTYGTLRGLALAGAVIHGKYFFLGDVLQAFGESVQR